MILAMKYIYNEDLAKDMQGTYQVAVDDEVMHVIIKDGKVDPRLGPADSPTFSVSMDLDTYKALLLLEYSLEELIAQGKIKVKGSVADALEFYELMMPAIGEPECQMPSRRWPRVRTITGAFCPPLVR